jgi:hypothetical protein
MVAGSRGTFLHRHCGDPVRPNHITLQFARDLGAIYPGMCSGSGPLALNGPGRRRVIFALDAHLPDAFANGLSWIRRLAVLFLAFPS